MVHADAEVAALRTEVERLRQLVGPSELSYTELQAELIAARDAVKEAETAAGALRGELTEVYFALAKARQIEAVLRKTFPGRVYRALGRIRRAVLARLH